MGETSREAAIGLQSVIEKATASVYLADNLGHARAKWMDKNTYMLRMNVQRALGINFWATKLGDYKECESVRRKEGTVINGA